MAEGGDEHPEGCGVEDPVGRRPSDGPSGERPVPHQRREPVGQALHQGRGAIGVEEPDPSGYAADHPAGPFLAPGQQVEQAPERPQQDHTDRRGHHHEDGGRLRLAAVVAGRGVESVGDQEGHEGTPEHDVQHDRRTDALGPESEPGIGPGHPGLGEQPVAQGGPRGGAAGRDVAEGQRGQVDAEQAEPAGSVGRQHGVGQLGVGHQGADLEEDPEGQVADVDVGQ